MKSVPFFSRFSFKIIAGLICMLALVGIPFFFLFLSYHRDQILATIENSTSSMSRILTRELEVSVLEGRHHLLQTVVKSLPAEGAIRLVMIVDAHEKVVVSSDPSLVGRTMSRNQEPGCRECHISPILKTTTTLTDASGNLYYRNVNVIQNRASCHSCHNPRSTVNGILVMDFLHKDLQEQFRASLYRLLLMGGTMLALTIAVLYFMLKVLVLGKLKKFASVTEDLALGKFGKVSLPGEDEFSQLASRFNNMSSRLEEALQEVRGGKEYLENIINSMDDEIVVIDRQYRIVTANAAYIRNRRPAADGQPEDNLEMAVDSNGAASRTFQDGLVHKVLQRYMDPFGKERYIEAFSCPLKNESGEISQVIEVRRDITERRLMEANLAHSGRLVSLGFLASGLAHEINNPLGTISTFVDSLRRRLGRNKESDLDALEGLERSLGLIQKEIGRAKDVTQRLLVLAQKEDSGKSLVNLNESLEETVALLRSEAARREIEMITECSPGMPTLKIAESQIRQVFMNLLLNSLQVGHRHGCVQCRTWREEDRVFTSIRDDGPGIEPQDLSRIFEPFFSKKDAGLGTGLGLFICKSILTSMGGDIRVESQPGQGATFTVWLPIHP